VLTTSNPLCLSLAPQSRPPAAALPDSRFQWAVCRCGVGMINLIRGCALGSVVFMGGFLGGCGGSSADGPQSLSTSKGNVVAIDRSASGESTRSAISGTPAPTATVGDLYSFQPAVANVGSSSRFSITHQPSWAKFDATTGRLSGTPAASEVGKYAGISITLSHGQTSVSLPIFSITVASASQHGGVALQWEAPTENSDGHQLKDLKGYRIHYGTKPRKYSRSITVENAGLTTYVVDNLTAGHYYFAVSAYSSSGRESLLSAEVGVRVD